MLRQALWSATQDEDRAAALLVVHPEQQPRQRASPFLVLSSDRASGRVSKDAALSVKGGPQTPPPPIGCATGMTGAFRTSSSVQCAEPGGLLATGFPSSRRRDNHLAVAGVMRAKFFADP